MSRVLTEGFESGDTLRWVSATLTTTAASVHTGVYAMNGQGQLIVPESYEYVVRFWFKVTGSGHTLFTAWYNGVSLCSITFGISDGTGGLKYYANNNTYQGQGAFTQFAFNEWYMLEVYFISDVASGSINARVDGKDDFFVSGKTSPLAGQPINKLYIGDSDANGRVYVDDIAINNTAGVVDNSFPGDGRVLALKPNANGDSSQLVGSDGNSTDNYLLVDDVPYDSDTTYVESTTVDQYDLYHIEDLALTDVNILRVIPRAIAKQTIAESGKLSVGIKSGSTEDWCTEQELAASYTYYFGEDYRLDPDTGAAWTISGVSNLQIGVKIK